MNSHHIKGHRRWDGERERRTTLTHTMQVKVEKKKSFREAKRSDTQRQGVEEMKHVAVAHH